MASLLRFGRNDYNNNTDMEDGQVPFLNNCRNSFDRTRNTIVFKEKRLENFFRCAIVGYLILRQIDLVPDVGKLGNSSDQKGVRIVGSKIPCTIYNIGRSSFDQSFPKINPKGVVHEFAGKRQ